MRGRSLIWPFISTKRRESFAREASQSRADPVARNIAWAAVLLYNAIGLFDIWSTAAGISAGAGEEANPVIKAAMEHFGAGWIGAKLVLQLLISGMVLWFPHRIVVAIFLTAVAFNAGVVWDNLRIAGFF